MKFTKTEPALFTGALVAVLSALGGSGVSWLTSSNIGYIAGGSGAVLSFVVAVVTRQIVWSPASVDKAVEAAVNALLPGPADAVMTVQPEPTPEPAPAPAKKAAAKKAAPAPAADPAPAAPAVDVAAIQAQIDALQAQLPPSA